MSIEQVRLIELILYYRIKASTRMQEIISLITDKKTLKQIDMYIRQNHDTLDEKQLEKYMENILNSVYYCK